MPQFDLPSGLTIPGNIPDLNPDSYFELPVIVQARLAPMNLIEIGAFSGIYGGKIGHCSIGRYCSIASGVDIASDQHPIDWLSSSMIQYVPDVHGWGSWLKESGFSYEEPEIGTFNSNAPVKIGNDVWIGQGVFIKSGIKVGDGAVIAAHSVVVEDVPPFSVVAGVPARVKRMRFSDNVIDRITRTPWWNYNIMGMNIMNFSSIDETLDIIDNKLSKKEVEPFNSPKIYFKNLKRSSD